MTKNPKPKPRIFPTVDQGVKKYYIRLHLRALPDEYKPFFRRPRWDTQYLIMRGTHGYAISYNQGLMDIGGPGHDTTVVYQLTTDSGDRDVYHNVKHIRIVQ